MFPVMLTVLVQTHYGSVSEGPRLHPLSETMWLLEVDDGHSCLDNNGWDVDLLQIVGNWKQNLLKILDSCSKGTFSYRQPSSVRCTGQYCLDVDCE